MNKFGPDKHYKIIPDKVVDSIAHLTHSGMELIIQYLNEKYNANIQQSDIPFYFLQDVEKYIDILNNKISEARKNEVDFRFAWLPGTTHAVFIAYIKEGKEEAIFYSDSVGTEKKIPNFSQKLAELTGVPVYASLEGRQADPYSCYVDALVFGRDVTGYNINTGNYRIPNLLSVLKDRVEQKLGHNSFEVKLPNELLKTSQLSKFTDFHTEEKGEDKLIHKAETLTLFRERYSKKALINDHEKIVSTYLAEKGMKYVDIIEIQFYH